MNNIADKVLIMLQKRFSSVLAYPLSNLSANHNIITKLDDEQLDFLVKYRKELIELLSDADESDKTARYMSRMMMSYLLGRNQFLTIQGAGRQELISIYRAQLNAFREIMLQYDDRKEIADAFEEYLKSHFTGLRDYTIKLFRQMDKYKPDGSSLSETVCAQYSVRLQLGILGIGGIKNLTQPVLDVGCGKDAPLVRYLLRNDIEAYGMDRDTIARHNIIDADWFEIELEPESWGTIISHMAFSLHFFHHHLRSDGDPSKFASRYMQLLHSLKKGGRFIYSPGLPFIEQLLPSDKYIVERKDIAFEDIQNIKNRIQIKNQTIGDIFYSSHIIKV